MENEVMQEIRERIVRIETLLETKINIVDDRVKKIEDNLTWLWRTVIAAIISAGIALYIKK